MKNENLPHVKRMKICTGHDYLTFVDQCQCDRSKVAFYTRFAVFGTDYGHLHNTAGGMRLWKTYSGAYAAMRKYVNR